MDTDATGPEQIRDAFSTAIDTTAERAEEITGIAQALIEVADRYAAGRMNPATVQRLRAAAEAVATAGTGLAAAGQDLQAALTDFNHRDGAVGDTVAEAGGNLADTPILVDTGDEVDARPEYLGRCAVSAGTGAPAEAKSAHFPGGRWRPRTFQRYGDRIPTPAAQGVVSWYRELAGRMFRFTLVVDGWWGVGEMGTLCVSAQISNGDWYTIHRLTPPLSGGPR